MRRDRNGCDNQLDVLFKTVAYGLYSDAGDDDACLLILCQFRFSRLFSRSRGHLRNTFQQTQRTLSTNSHVSPKKRILYSEWRDVRRAKNRAMLMYSTAVVRVL